MKGKRPTVTAWVPLGSDNFRLLRERLLTDKQFDISVSVTIQFPKGSVKSEALGKSVQWDGKGALPITNAVVVWKRHDWSADFDHKPQGLRHPEPYEPPREHVEILAATSRVEAGIAKLTTPLWLAVAALAWIAFALK